MNLNITVITDSNNWINAYMPDWIRALEARAHRVVWLHDVQQIEPGDLAFFLGCEQIAGKSVLSRNTHNLVVHASDLPQGKGWSPLTWKIIGGENRIPVVLFEAAEKVDSGRIYLRTVMEFAGNELIGELRKVLAETTFQLCDTFAARYPQIIGEGWEQQGVSSFYPRRTPQDSRLRTDRTIAEQFPLFRVADNDRYPCYFELGGETYILKIEKKVETR